MSAQVEGAILRALQELGRATARQIETHDAVMQACRAAKLKARGRLDMMMRAGKVQSDRAYQGAVYWC